MLPSEVYSRFKSLESFNIYELLMNSDIGIYYQPTVFNKIPNSEAVILVTDDNTAGIFLRDDPDLNPQHTLFLLWHEYGHYLIDGPSGHTRHFDQAALHSKDEQAANILAVFALIDPKETTEDLCTLSNKKGIPFDVLVDTVFRIGLDPSMKNYYL